MLVFTVFGVSLLPVASTYKGFGILGGLSLVNNFNQPYISKTNFFEISLAYILLIAIIN